ncbi:hypothetical protein CC78DRAFT_366722 [Lojkania enalia]|uniref:Uncharacterized protein n=1 Tax=Lojkania enalia TaxID=147567 RepID=A0A9P4K4D2_9PLEO|nr:hypothetical protein CC78DRAFT_366722 [Didymosphaeria enalia]
MPRPSAPPTTFSFPSTSGNFDFPHASASPPPASRDSGAHGNNLRQPVARQREQQDPAARESPAADDEEHNLIPPPRPRLEPPRRRQLRRSLPSEREPPPREPTTLLRRPTPPTNNPPRATPSERYLRRSHARLREQRANTMDSFPDVLDSLGEDPIPNPFTLLSMSSGRSRSPGPENESTRKTKRRKLEHELGHPPGYECFKYGYKGQVVPGRLKMEVVSCDGGEYEKYSASRTYKIQNVLKNDKSVYCSESSSCNILLKHIGEAPFCLEKVVIKAPDRGFTAPVQEGMIFVSMSPDDLLSGTAGYKIEYKTPSRQSPTPSSGSPGDQQLSLQEALEDPYIWNFSREGMQEAMEEQIERLRLRSRRLQVGSSVRSNRERRREERRTAASRDQENAAAENCEDPTEDSYATATGVLAPTPPPFTITTESDDDTDESEELASPAIMADRLRRESRWRGDSDDGEDDLIYRMPPRRSYQLDSLENYVEGRWRRDRFLDPIRATRLRTPSRIEPKDDLLDPDNLIAPHARFFIAKNKNKITIKFHPAVSGKYILLKLWSPAHDGNIDIQSVQFSGYSGPRFFPALQPR